MLTIQLSTLGQTDLSGTDPELLHTLDFLLEQARKNVQDALADDRAELTAGDEMTSNPDYAPTPESPF